MIISENETSWDKLARLGLTRFPVDGIAEHFSNFFVSKVEMIRSALDSNAASQTPHCALAADRCFTGTSLCDFLLASTQEITAIIRDSSPTSCASDPIPAFLVRECLLDLVGPITTIINNSLNNFTVPDAFKAAIVKPIPKKSNPDIKEMGNFRPISQLPFLSKVLE